MARPRHVSADHPEEPPEIAEYAEIDQAVSAKAGQINGTFGEVAWTPIRYINKTHRARPLPGFTGWLAPPW